MYALSNKGTIENAVSLLAFDRGQHRSRSHRFQGKQEKRTQLKTTKNLPPPPPPNLSLSFSLSD